MIFQLIYTCALAPTVTTDDLEIIASTSRQRNAERGVTGMLLYKDGSVLQVLEGEKTYVLDLYARISNDFRVSNALVLIQRMAEHREFPNWSMGLKNTGETHSAFKLCAQTFPDILPHNASPEVGTISRTFARVNGLA